MSVISIGVAVMPAIHTTDCPVRLVNSEGAWKAGGGEGGTGRWGGGRGGRGGDVGGDGGGVGVDSSNNDSSPMLVGRCDCSKGVLTEIRCYYLTSIPKFLLPPGFDSRQRVFSAIYITRQKISEVPRAAFANIQVSKISLDFNPFGDRLDPESFLGLESVLRELSLGACRIRNLPVGLLKNLNRLERLQLWGNRIEQIPSGFFSRCFQFASVVDVGQSFGGGGRDDLRRIIPTPSTGSRSEQDLDPLSQRVSTLEQTRSPPSRTEQHPRHIRRNLFQHGELESLEPR